MCGGGHVLDNPSHGRHRPDALSLPLSTLASCNRTNHACTNLLHILHASSSGGGPSILARAGGLSKQISQHRICIRLHRRSFIWAQSRHEMKVGRTTHNCERRLAWDPTCRPFYVSRLKGRYHHTQRQFHQRTSTFRPSIQSSLARRANWTEVKLVTRPRKA